MPCALVFAAPLAVASTSRSRSRAPSLSPIALELLGQLELARERIRRRRRRANGASMLRHPSAGRHRLVEVERDAGEVEGERLVARVGRRRRPPRSAVSGILSVDCWNAGRGRSRRIRLGGVERRRLRRRADVRVVEVEVEVAELRCRGCAESAPTERAELRRHRDDRLRQRARAERLDQRPPPSRRALRRAAGLVQRVLGIDLRAELLRLGPVLALAARQREQLRGEQLEALGVAPLGVDLEQLGADRQALGVAAHRLLEDLLGLQVAAVGQVDVGLGHRVDVADRIELAQRVGHRRRAAGRHRGCRCAGRRWRRRTNRAAGGSRGTRSRRCPSSSAA